MCVAAEAGSKSLVEVNKLMMTSEVLSVLFKNKKSQHHVNLRHTSLIYFCYSCPKCREQNQMESQ